MRVEKCWILNRGRKQDISEGPFLKCRGKFECLQVDGYTSIVLYLEHLV